MLSWYNHSDLLREETRSISAEGHLAVCGPPVCLLCIWFTTFISACWRSWNALPNNPTAHFCIIVKGNSSAATKALCVRLHFCKQRGLYISHKQKTRYRAYICNHGAVLLRISSRCRREGRNMWALLSAHRSKQWTAPLYLPYGCWCFIFTAGSSTILTVAGDHLFAIGPFPLATCIWAGRLFKGAKVNQEGRQQVYQTKSHAHVW